MRREHGCSREALCTFVFYHQLVDHRFLVPSLRPRVCSNPMDTSDILDRSRHCSQIENLRDENAALVTAHMYTHNEASDSNETQS